MPGSITPLPVMLEQFEQEDRDAYNALKAPKTIVVRYGYLRQVAELPYDGEDKPGCGSKLVARTPRGVELVEMLTTTCANNGCSKSVSRKQMLQYIDNSGGKDYPFTTEGQILRIATIDDLNEQARLENDKSQIIKRTRQLIAEMKLPMKLVEVERLLGGERIIFYYISEQWVDFRDLVKRMASEFQTRIEMHQVNARDEARVAADYNKCGQHCCCKQFLKVLKPVSMKSAKNQQMTLDPHKISGRCGRLMCCLRYEDVTYEDLRKRLPRRKARILTDDGPGTVIDSQILTQLVLVRLDSDLTGRNTAAYPLENIKPLPKDYVASDPRPNVAPRQESDDRGRSRRTPRRSEPAKPQAQGEKPETTPPQGEAQENSDEPRSRRSRRRRRPRPGQPLTDHEVESREGTNSADPQASSDNPPGNADDRQGDKPKRRRRRRRRRGGGGKGGQSGGGSGGSGGSGGDA